MMYSPPTTADKLDARARMTQAIYHGILVRPDHCEGCHREFDYKLHGHHEDYSKPLDIVWLCRNCHGARHRLPIRDRVSIQFECDPAWKCQVKSILALRGESLSTAFVAAISEYLGIENPDAVESNHAQ